MSSNVVDDRVVEMRFDNSDFEKNVQQTIKTTEALNKALQFKGAEDGLSGISKAANKIDLSGLSSAVESVAYKFSALEVAAITTIANIVTSAVRAGERIAYALTIEPISMGLQEFELEMDSIQRILANTASKGTTLTDVTKALDELNVYADKTIYNFGQMTRAIGLFTAKGVDLDTSVTAIEGIANLSAMAGADATQNARVMYQISQALGSGYFKQIDWYSINTAGLNTEAFRDMLKMTAQLRGVDVDALMAKNNESFEQTLHRGWLTPEVFLEAISHFNSEFAEMGDAQKELLRSQGYTEEQIEYIHKVAVGATEAATLVKTFSQLWSTLREEAQTGWAETWKLIVGDFEEAKKFINEDLYKPMSKVLSDMNDARNNLLRSWKELGGRDDLIESIRTSFTIIARLWNLLSSSFKTVFPPVTAERLKAFTDSFLKLMQSLEEKTKYLGRFKNILVGMLSIIKFIIEVNKALFSILKDIFDLSSSKLGPIFNSLLTIISDFFSRITVMLKDIGSEEIKKAIVDTLNSVFIYAKKLAPYINNFITIIEDALYQFERTGWTKFFEKIKDIMSFVLGYAGKFIDFLHQILESISNIRIEINKDRLLDHISVVFEKVGKFIGKIAAGLGKAAKAFRDILGNVDMNTFLIAIDTIASGAGFVTILNFIEKFGVVGEAVDYLEELKYMAMGIGNALKSFSLKEIGIGLLAIASAAWIISTIDGPNLERATSAIITMALGLAGALGIISKFAIVEIKNAAGLTLAVGTLITISTAVLILALALRAISKIDDAALYGAFVIIEGLLYGLVGAAALLSKFSVQATSGVLAIIGLSIAILIVARALKNLSRIDGDAMDSALGAMFAIIAMFTIFVAVIERMKAVNPTSMGLAVLAIVALTGAILVLSVAFKVLGSMSWDSLGRAITAMGLIIASMLVVIYALSKSVHATNKATIGATQMIAFAIAMFIIASAIKMLGDLSLQQAVTAVVAVAGVLGIMVAVMTSLNSKGSLFATLDLMAIAVAILAMAAALRILSSADITGMIAGAVVLSLTLAAFAGLVYVLNQNKGALLSSTAILLFSVAVLALAVALKTLSKIPLKQLYTSLYGIATVLVLFLLAGAVAEYIGPGLLILGGAMLMFGAGCLAAGLGMLAFATGFAALVAALAGGAAVFDAVLTSIPQLFKAIAEGVIQMVLVFKEQALVIADALITMLTAFISKLAEHAPEIAESLMTIFLTILYSIRDNIGPIVDALFSILYNLFAAIYQWFVDHEDDIKQWGIDMFNKIKEGFGNAIPKIRDKISELVATIKLKLITLANNFVQMGKDMVAGFIRGIRAKIRDAADAAFEMANTAWAAAKGALLIKSPSKKFQYLGEESGEGLILGMNKMVSDVAKESEIMANTSLSGFDNFKDRFETLSSVNSLATITPVFDGSAVDRVNMDLAGNIATSMVTTVNPLYSAITESQQALTDSNNQVIQAIDGFRSEIKELLNTDSEIGLYVDGRRLATSLAPAMNKQLNVLARREGGL